MKFSWCLVAALWAVSLPAHAATYYTATTGNDANTCAQAQAVATPKKSVAGGLGCLKAGDTLLVRAGTYDEQLTSVPSGSSWTDAPRVAAYPGTGVGTETVWLKPTVNRAGVLEVIWLDGNYHYFEFDGINADGTRLPGGLGGVVWFSTNNNNDPHHIRYKNAEVISGAVGSQAGVNLGGHTAIGATGAFQIQHVKVHGGGQIPCPYSDPSLQFQCNSYGIYVAGPNNLVEDCELWDNASGGLQIYNASGDSPDNNTIRRNYIHDQTRFGNASQMWGIIVSGSNNLIYDNVIANIGGSSGSVGEGIILYDGNNHKVYNNTILNVRGHGINVSAAGVVNAIIRNNIAYQSSAGNYADSGTGTIHDHNSDTGTNPNLVNPAGGDYHLTAASLTALNLGMTLTEVPTDKDGLPRPQGSAYDLGAYELKVGGPTALTNLKIAQ